VPPWIIWKSRRRQHPARQAAADRAAEDRHQPALAERRVAGVDRHADLDREVAQVLERGGGNVKSDMVGLVLRAPGRGWRRAQCRRRQLAT
jgi:hypothetical protein